MKGHGDPQPSDLWIVRLPFVGYALLQMYRTPRDRGMYLHLKLGGTVFFTTIILSTNFQLKWISREAHCLATAPYIAKLSFVLSLVASTWLTISQTAVFLRVRHLSFSFPLVSGFI
ncbi:hypothetical protein C8Q79DRAFT_636974 [Trametes meyenii]|nr:hypothetical protein C8Q79DRAFT_636974 [Trametes meyenii]